MNTGTATKKTYNSFVEILWHFEQSHDNPCYERPTLTKVIKKF